MSLSQKWLTLPETAKNQSCPHMKKIHRFPTVPTLSALLTAVVLFCAAPVAEARLERGEKSFGPKVGYVSKNQSAMAGLVFEYTFSKHFRLAPEVGMIFRHKDLDAFTVDVNAHVPFGFENDKVALYPLVGANFTSWNRHGVDSASGDDVNTHVNRFGINAGGGVELRCTEALRLSLEAKYVFLRDYPTTVISLGISYVF